MKSKAVVFSEPYKVSYEDIEVGEPGPGELLLEAECTLISPGTERSWLTGVSGIEKYPFHIGYSFGGRVIKIGPGPSPFGVGDRVIAMAPHQGHAVVSSNGAFKAPEDVSIEEASFFVLAVTALLGLRYAKPVLGESIAMLGLGPIGNLAVQFARMAGGAPVIAMDRDPHRLEMAVAVGADIAIDTRDPAQMARLKALPGGGPAVVLELTSQAAPLELAVEIAQPGGRVTLVSAGVGSALSPAALAMVFEKALSVTGTAITFRPWSFMAAPISLGATAPAQPYGGAGETHRADIELFLWCLQNGRVNTKTLISHREPASNAKAVYDRLLAYDPAFTGPILLWK